MDVKNLRGTERFNLTEALTGSFGSASVTILNISVDGLKIEHAQPIRLGTRARLWFKRADVAVSVQALLVWSHLSKNPNDKGKYLYNSGLRVETSGDEFSLALQSLVDKGIAVQDMESLDKKRQRLIDRTREKTAQPTMKVIKHESDISPDQALLIEHARERLRSNPDEAMKWYNRAKYAITHGGAYVASEIRNREDVLAVWEYLERSVDLSTIVRVFERNRSTNNNSGTT
jgi:hypothetical protein